MNHSTFHKIDNIDDLEESFSIRREVFILEQGVSEAEEFDEFENSAIHFLARLDGKPAGTSRYRQTAKGFKLERFAVLRQFRNRKIGTGLMQEMVIHINSMAESGNGNNFLYLHAQTGAIPFYLSFEFKPSGSPFYEADIEHILMYKNF